MTNTEGRMSSAERLLREDWEVSATPEIKNTGKKAPRIQNTGKKAPRIDPAEVAKDSR